MTRSGKRTDKRPATLAVAVAEANPGIGFDETRDRRHAEAFRDLEGQIAAVCNMAQLAYDAVEDAIGGG